MEVGSIFRDNSQFIDPLQNRLRYRLENVPPGSYQQVAFAVGLNEKTNYADPSQWPADHPLNPLINDLHWSWQGGYVFLRAGRPL